MKQGVFLLVLAASTLLVDATQAWQERTRLQRIADAVTELDLAEAQRLLDEADHDSPALSFERARLAIYRGDCDTAAAILSAPTYSSTEQGASLGRLARSCAGATAAALVVRDHQLGVWVRLQDERDRVLVPLLVNVAARARQSFARALGVELPRPLRLEIVRDNYSLSAVTGLPIQAAETTGTVAVARWGRVSMISPRAMPHGYPWEDTLAHEIVHLVLSRASRDRAPLWLQEGIAKRLETRWRAERPFDVASYDDVARTALLSGQSVGIDHLGPSIAMLPSPDTARIAYAEVASFTSYWIGENGEPALRLLLADLRGTETGGAEAAMGSVTGYELGVWVERWRRQLVSRPSNSTSPPGGGSGGESRPQSLKEMMLRAKIGEAARRVRLGDLLFDRGHSLEAAGQFDLAVAAAENEPAVRWRAARARLDSGEADQARERLGGEDDISSAHGAWFALRGRFLRQDGKQEDAQASFLLGIALDPLREDVACEGHWTARSARGGSARKPFLPAEPTRGALCKEARLLNRQD
jgi:hypothetical protein